MPKENLPDAGCRQTFLRMLRNIVSVAKHAVLHNVKNASVIWRGYDTRLAVCTVFLLGELMSICMG